MKDKMKNTLEHEVELLGRSVSVLLIAGLLVVGGASAALLNSFGEITGDADVEQAITVNEEDAEDGFVQNFDFNGATEVVGETFTESNTIENNVGSSQQIYFNGEVTTPDVELEDDYVDESADAYTAEHLLLENGQVFTNEEDATDDDVEEEETELAGDYSTGVNYVHNTEMAVEASYEQGEGGHIHSGIWFNVEETPADEVEISATAEEENDWLYVIVSDVEDTPYLVGRFDGENSLEPTSEDALIYELDEGSINEIESRDDFTKTQRNSDAVNVQETTVHYAAAATGTAGDGQDKGTVTYTDFTFEQDGSSESLFQEIDFAIDEEVTVPEGQSEFGTVIDFELNAYPGNYDFTLGVNPE